MRDLLRRAVVDSPDYPFTPIEAPVKLDQNESADDFPSELKAIVLDRMLHAPWNRYPDLNSEAICAAIAQFEQWPRSGVVVATGSNVLIALLTQLAGIGRRVLTVKPSFALYGLAAKLLDASLTEVALDEDLSLDVGKLIAAVGPAGGNAPAGALFLPQPHAPSGAVMDERQLRAVVEAARQWLVVVDEAYHQFSGTDARPLAREHANVVVLRTFSKAWGLAGLRMGYALASDEVARHLRKLVAPFAASVVQAQAVQVALAHPGYMRERVRSTVAERERVAAALRLHPTWRVFGSSTNFLLVRTPDAAAAFDRLLAQGVLVRRQDSYFGLRGCLRVTIGTPEENDRFLAAAGAP